MKKIIILLPLMLLSMSMNKNPYNNNIVRIKDKIVSNSIMYSFRYQDRATLVNSMEKMGYKDIKGYNLNELRRIMIAYEYDALFWDMRDRTGFSIGFFFAYFVYEATYHGIETESWRKHWNPGGIKYRGEFKWFKAEDDCKGPCRFTSFPDYESAILLWSEVMNNRRYDHCKSMSKPLDICKCVRDAGYHTDNSYVARANIMQSYWSYRKHFPILGPKQYGTD